MNREFQAIFENGAALDYERMLMDLRQLRKAFGVAEANPTAERVHAIRSAARRIGLTLDSMRFDAEEADLWPLDGLDRIEKKAGDVRDLDVIASMAGRLKLGAMEAGERKCRERLQARLDEEREQQARRLIRQMKRNSAHTRKQLKRISSFIQSVAASEENLPQRRRFHASFTVSAHRLLTDVARWQPLTEECLHSYRIQVRELRILLQMGGESDGAFTIALGEVKDAIGEWHDWLLLAQSAGEVSEHGPDCGLLRLIAWTEKDLLDQAVASATRMRRQFLTSITRSPLLSPQFAA